MAAAAGAQSMRPKHQANPDIAVPGTDLRTIEHISKWPTYYRRLWYSKYRKVGRRYPDNTERFRLWCFLVGNGVRPETASREMSRWFASVLDKAAQRQLVWLATQCANASSRARLFSRYFYYDMYKHMYCFLNGSPRAVNQHEAPLFL